MTYSPQITIYADESCLGNQFQNRANPGGAGGLMEYWNGDEWVRRDYWISDENTTNNRMALQSAIEGLTLLEKSTYEIHFVSDSQYLIKGMTEWMIKWKSRGWKRKGGEIENLELWKKLDLISSKYKVKWSWVRGHHGHPQNEYANHLAIRAAKEGTTSEGLIESKYETWLEKQNF